MAERHVINADLVEVVDASDGKTLLRMLAWGDPIEVVEVKDSAILVRVTKFVEQDDGSILPTQVDGLIDLPKSASAEDVVIPRQDNRVLKVDFVDVQQGDGCVIETAKGQVMLVDGGDNQLFARYLASRFRGTSAGKPKVIECILVTHGDADHFQGLTEIHKSETNTNPDKRLFIYPKRVYHNGIVKRPSRVDGKTTPNLELLGPTIKVNDTPVLVGLKKNLMTVADKEMNEPFREWKQALKAFQKRGDPIVFERLAAGDDDAFSFLKNESIDVEVLGPLVTRVNNKDALPFLRQPKKGPRIGHESLALDTTGLGGFSASHTINGHSVLLRLTYGKFSFLLAGDLNDHAERELTLRHQQKKIDLRAEVLKVPHHGSADFSGAFLQAVSPVISVVSSGDESARKDFIHPRATLMGALGRYSRLEEPLIFVTELVAFFRMEGFVTPEKHKTMEGQLVVDPEAGSAFFAFSRAAFGIVMVRTDGDRLLVYTNSAQTSMKEIYAYTVNAKGVIEPAEVRRF